MQGVPATKWALAKRKVMGGSLQFTVELGAELELPPLPGGGGGGGSHSLQIAVFAGPAAPDVFEDSPPGAFEVGSCELKGRSLAGLRAGAVVCPLVAKDPTTPTCCIMFHVP